MIYVNKQTLQKFSIYALALAGGILINFAIESGDTMDYLYGIIPLVTGLFYVFMEVKK